MAIWPASFARGNMSLTRNAVIIWLALLLLASLSWRNAQAQSVRWQTVQKSTAAGNADSVYFSFRGTGIFSTPMEADTAALNPPDQVAYNHDALLTLRSVSGDSSCDSLIAYVKGLDFAGRIIHDDSVFVFGTSFAAPASATIRSNRRLYAASLTNLAKYINGFVVIYKHFDVVGGPWRWEWACGTF